MNRNIRKRNGSAKIVNILSYLLALIIIFNCNTVYVTSTNFGFISSKLPYLLIICTVIYVIYQTRLNGIKADIALLIGVLLAMYLGIFVVFNSILAAKITGISIVINFITVFMLVWVERHSRIPKILQAYANIMVIIATVSIVFWIFGSYLHLIAPNKMVSIAWGDPSRMIPSYYNIYFETQYFNFTIRNSAIFVEAPMAALNFLLALSILVLFQDKTKFNKIKVIILIIAGCLTISTTIYIGLMLLFIFKLFSNKNANRSVEAIKYVFSIVAVPTVFYIISQLFSSKLMTNSGISRKLDYLNAFSAWKNNPIFGMGINAGLNEGVNVINGIKISHYGFSSSFSKLLGDGGLFIILPVVLAIVISIRKSMMYKDRSRMFFTIILVYLFMTIIFAQNYLMYYLFILIALWTPYRFDHFSKKIQI